MYFFTALLRLADGKDAVSFLPGEGGERRERVVDPLGGSRLHRPHQVRYGTVGSPAEIEMHMVFYAANVVEHALVGPHNPADVGVETIGDVGGDPRTARFCGEDNVE
jgi:hypothetical protein